MNNEEEEIKRLKETMKAYQGAQDQLNYMMEDLQDMDRMIQMLREKWK